MNIANICENLPPASPALSQGCLHGLMTMWVRLRARHRGKIERVALSELSKRTLDDINAPCWMYLEAMARREAEGHRLDALRVGNNLSW